MCLPLFCSRDSFFQEEQSFYNREQAKEKLLSSLIYDWEKKERLLLWLMLFITIGSSFPSTTEIFFFYPKSLPSWP